MASIVVGGLLILTGYGSSVAWALGDLGFTGCRGTAADVGFIPVVGSWLSMIAHGTCSSYDITFWGWRAAEVIVQAAGLSMIIAGVLGGRRVVAIDAATSIRVGPGGVDLSVPF